MSYALNYLEQLVGGYPTEDEPAYSGGYQYGYSTRYNIVSYMPPEEYPTTIRLQPPPAAPPRGGKRRK